MTTTVQKTINHIVARKPTNPLARRSFRFALSILLVNFLLSSGGLAGQFRQDRLLWRTAQLGDVCIF
jgi:hypothetical protein